MPDLFSTAAPRSGGSSTRLAAAQGGSERDAAPLSHRLAALTLRCGAWQVAGLIALATALLSLAITWTWFRWQGEHELGDAFYLALLIPLPLSMLGAYPMLCLVTALERTRRQVELLSITDPLTALHNRRHFMEAARRQLMRARRHDQPLSLMLIDVDHFKQVNDRHGHQAGDRVLVEVARRCRDTLRAGDLIARFGGEEFIVLLPSTPQAAAAALAEHLRRAVARAPLALPDEARPPSLHLTVSIGLVAQATPHQTLDTLIRRADEALYAAKRAGRDRVHVAAPDGPADGMRPHRASA
ncbi:diguanylate cyclase (GGDEF)-like protein [Sphaerotilus hippei]|uniref:diguanylate cyclase n=1 Tax=Sphaerotilus hippei TaxID=744406 RepID=A0A318H436_9BURK|nr:GGDEF domain-containing protein [Sphaerotilus hippei]PXW96606.1 diguanylate cyclase (GGDEF)-like protein [Sphaerotilus hippei]